MIKAIVFLVFVLVFFFGGFYCGLDLPIGGTAAGGGAVLIVILLLYLLGAFRRSWSTHSTSKQKRKLDQ